VVPVQPEHAAFPLQRDHLVEETLYVGHIIDERYMSVTWPSMPIGIAEISQRLSMWLATRQPAGAESDQPTGRGTVETWDAIRARRNVRSYTDDTISDADLDRITEAGWRAPSASNRQHWDFVVVSDRTQLAELSTVWRGAGHIAGAAAAIALVLPEPPDERTRLTDRYDLGQATYAILLAATDLGIGTGHSSVGEQDKARAILGVPDDHLVAYLIGLGYPADRPLQPIAKPDRRPLDEVVHRGHW